MPEQENRKRVIESANFNCVFGDNNEPLLAHFKDVLYPALTASNVIKYSNGYFNVENIKITEHPTLGYILTGVFVKQTELEILSQRDQDTGKCRASSIYITINHLLKSGYKDTSLTLAFSLVNSQ